MLLKEGVDIRDMLVQKEQAVKKEDIIVSVVENLIISEVGDFDDLSSKDADIMFLCVWLRELNNQMRLL